MNNFFKYISLVTVVTLVSFTATADVDTTSSLRGNVNVAGATVEAEFVPTGLTKTTTAGTSGNFSLSFLPVGGPYKLTVSASGYDTETLSGIYLNLAQVGDV